MAADVRSPARRLRSLQDDERKAERVFRTRAAVPATAELKKRAMVKLSPGAAAAALQGARIGLLRGPFGFRPKLVPILGRIAGELTADGAVIVELSSSRRFSLFIFPLYLYLSLSSGPVLPRRKIKRKKKEKDKHRAFLWLRLDAAVRNFRVKGGGYQVERFRVAG